jgi:hypothetical protein
MDKDMLEIGVGRIFDPELFDFRAASWGKKFCFSSKLQPR